MLKNLLLSLLLLSALAVANPPPAGNWLEGLFAEQHWDLRLQIRLIDIGNYVYKVTVPAMRCLKNMACGHFSSSVFASLENGGMPKLEELNPISAPDFVNPNSIQETSALLTKITGKRVVRVHYDNVKQTFKFIKNNIGRGDHVLLTLETADESEAWHTFNVANLDGKLTIIDVAQRINGKHLTQPLEEALRSRRVGMFKIARKSNYVINFTMRDNRTYAFPETYNGSNGQLSESEEVLDIAGTYDSNRLKTELDQLNLCQ